MQNCPSGRCAPFDASLESAEPSTQLADNSPCPALPRGAGIHREVSPTESATKERVSFFFGHTATPLMEETKRRLSQLWSRIAARSSAVLTVVLFSAAVALAMAATDGSRPQNHHPPSTTPVASPLDVLATTTAAPTEAPAGFDEQSNGLVDGSTHGMDAGVFAEV